MDLYGTSVLLEEFGRVIKPGGSGIVISSQSGHRLPALTPEQDALLATTPDEDLLKLDMLQPSAIRDTLHAYQLAKRCNVKRVMAKAVKWGRRGARINSISPGIIVTPLALDQISGHRIIWRKSVGVSANFQYRKPNIQIGTERPEAYSRLSLTR